MKIAFLILHYNTIDDTIKCIDSINKNVKESYHIVVVDNCSPNGTGNQLLEKYRNDNNITIIINKKNLGFAKGNNIGFKYIKENLNVKYIAMINNDTYLLDNKFVEIIEKEYNYSGFSVLGPKILLPNNRINPIQQKLINKSQLKHRIIRMKIMYLFNYLYMQKIYDFSKKIFFKFISKERVGLGNNYNEKVDLRQEDIVLHGAFLIFSKKYIDMFDGIDSRTYMYMEEKLLAARLKKYNLKSVYNPKIKIFHNEDSATNSIKKSDREKNLFVYKNAIKSSKILLKELEELEKDENSKIKIT